MTQLRQIELDDRYAAARGPALLTGIQALVRLLLEQRRLDAARGLDTGAFVSGYPGSPLGGLDRELMRAERHLAPLGVVFEPGLNEELAATAVAGTQLIGELPGRRRDGVVGWWYGKAPGLDRAADAIRHGNVSGTAHLGGAVALIGDDPLCKSSTLPSSCELMAESLVLPLLAPASVADVVRLGLHAVAMSRHAGLWTALKIVSDVADSTAAVQLEALAEEVPPPPREARGAPPMLLGASSVAAEHDLMSARLARARDYGREQRLNRVVFEPAQPRVALVAPGPAFATVQRALEQLGLAADDALGAVGIRLVRLELVWPLHPDDAAAWADGVDEILVVEDKRPFVERQLRDLLYDRGPGSGPRVLGKHDEHGRPLVAMDGAVDADALARALARRWRARLPDVARERLDKRAARARAAPTPLPLARTPFFCSGCPHNLSTKAPEDQLIGAGIGCHSLVAVDPAAMRGRLLGAPQMGGEGAQWIGMAPFTDDDHYIQNLGDGTFHHSGSLAIRAAVAAGLRITYRLLYNDAIAMTGGQTPPGRIGVVELTRWLLLEGVARVVVTAEDPHAFDGRSLPAGVAVRHRDELQQVQEELGLVDGVTVLIHTDRCATEERRLRKRGKLPSPAQRVWINERVCEGCGDCGRKSTCLSVVPTDTELGRKTQIHQSSCTQDLACLEGDCPSFLLVTPAKGELPKPAALPDVPVGLPEPTLVVDPDVALLIRMPGIGGTGVVTVSQILQMAAVLEGRWASGLDQTGLAQKGGAVISDVRIAPVPLDGALRAAGGEVDLLLGLDLLGAVTPDTLRTLDPERTVAIVNVTTTPTAAMVTDPDAPELPLPQLVERVERATRADRALWIDAGRIAEALFADHMPTNMIMLGAAYQHGCLPVGVEAIEQAIRLNGAAVEANLSAFRWGRAAAVDRESVARALAGRGPDALAAAAPPALPAKLAAAVGGAGFGPELERIVSMRAADLCGYGGAGAAERYVADVRAVVEAERAAVPGAAPSVSLAYARGLHKLTAYKDEYEVARLHLDALERARREAVFGPGARTQVLLHPPTLRALGLKRKLRLGRGALPLFRVLRALRPLRGTPLDPFGRSALRRLERELVGEYGELVERALTHLRPDTQAEVAAIAALPELVRGYEEVKLASVERYRQAASRQLARLEGATARG